MVTKFVSEMPKKYLKINIFMQGWRLSIGIFGKYYVLI